MASAVASDTTRLFTSPDDQAAKSWCPSRKRVKACALEALYGAIPGAIVGLATNSLFNLSGSPCILGFGVLVGATAGSITGVARKIVSYKNPYGGLCCNCFTGTIVGIAVGVGLGAALGHATTVTGCNTGPIGGIVPGMFSGGMAGLFAPIFRLIVADDPHDIDRESVPPPPPPGPDPSANEL